jgi:hypothetical protein
LAWNTNTLTSDGTLRIIRGVDPTPVPIVWTVIGGTNLLLNWPASHIGWALEAQTNPPGAGLGTNWVRIPGSTSVDQLSFPIAPANGSVFYRMVLP